MMNLLHTKDGPLTRELLRRPADFGLGQLPIAGHPDAVTQSICGYCATGCSLDIHLRGNTAIGLSPTKNYPVNLGAACPKGWEALSVMNAVDRATTPLLRDREGHLQPVSWTHALSQFTDRFKAIAGKDGPQSLAFLSTGQLVTEEMAFLGALAKFGMGMIHGDGNTRQCMATAVSAYKQSFGFDAPPYTYADFEESDVLVFVGSNPCLAHPIMWERVMMNPHSPEIIVIDPRATETAMNAQQHLAVNPKSDLTLLSGVARILIENDWIDHDFIQRSTNGFDDYRRFVLDFSLSSVSDATGLSEQQIRRFAETIHRGQRVSFWWTMGVNQSHQGTRTAQAIINLALMTGNIGRPGTGANSITGQCNAMGSRLFSNTTNLLGGHDFANAAHRSRVSEILSIDQSCIPEQASWSYDRIMEGIDRGEIRGLWIICTNTAHSWIDQNKARETLKKLDFLVVQDIYDTTETAQMADLVLPAAGWSEKDGTFINSERRIGVVQKTCRAPGEALADFSIFRLIADSWGCGDMFASWDSPERVFESLQRISKDTPCDISAIRGYQDLMSRGGIQWPCTEASVEKERRLFVDGRFFHADGRARFICDAPTPMAELPDDQFPLLLLTGRGSASQWHTQTRTSKSAVLRKLYPGTPRVEINPIDALNRGVETGDWVKICSRRGEMKARAVVTNTLRRGHVFIAMHDVGTNQLTRGDFDPHSRQPSYKSGTVEVTALRSEVSET
ncbi:MAG: nitrate reductase [Planctomycetaceae bacterium]|nr:nitrate reductase [Planctomycetaceae bacterium]